MTEAKKDVHVSEDEDDNDNVSRSKEDEECNWGAIRPSCCQRFANPKCVLFWLCCAATLQGIIVNGLTNTMISSIEKRFELSSTESGIIASCYDIGFVVTALPVSYIGGHGIKPRYLSFGIFVMGLGSLLFALPHFATDLYRTSGGELNTCMADVINGTSSCDAHASTGLSNYKFVFYLAQLLNGFGSAPLYTLGVTYLEENLPLRSSSFYVGIFYSFAIIGSALGYVAGGEFLKMYTDVGSVDTSSLSIDRYNPRWVGAWWMGFLAAAFLAFIVSFVFAGFPKYLPGSSEFQKEKGNEVYMRKSSDKEKIDKTGRSRSFKDILLSTKLILSNPTFILLTLAGTVEDILVGGVAAFGPKYIEYQFSVTSASAGQYTGFAAVPAGGGATFLGGYLVKRLKLSVRGIFKFCIVFALLALVFTLSFFMSCTNVPFAGVNIAYGEPPSSYGKLQYDVDNLSANCNVGCGCIIEEYHPVCGQDGVMYFSPCHAGCKTTYDGQKYSDCSCINFTETNSTPFSAVFGKCATSCRWLPIFMPFFSVSIFFVFIVSMPSLSATLRCVPKQQKSFALGIQWIIARCLGSIPAPILFGKIIDMTCELWQERCEGQGSCFIYDNIRMSYYFVALAVILKILSMVFYFLAALFYRTLPEQTDDVTLRVSVTSASQNTLASVLPDKPEVESSNTS